MASPENINMESESPEVQDENQSEEDEVISKNDLREVGTYKVFIYQTDKKIGNSYFM